MVTTGADNQPSVLIRRDLQLKHRHQPDKGVRLASQRFRSALAPTILRI